MRHGTVALVAGALDPPPDRGRLLDAAAIVSEVFHNQVSIQWVMRTVKGAGSGRVKLGRSTVRFWELDVRRWLEQRTRNSGAAA